MLKQLRIVNKLIISLIIISVSIILLSILVLNNDNYDMAIAAGGIAILLVLYLVYKFGFFRQELNGVLDELVADDFDVVMKKSNDLILDEVTNKMNRLIDRSKKFEKLRSGRVKTSTRLLNTVIRNVERGIMIGYLREEVVRLNPAAQKIFGIDQDKITLEAITRIPDNADFANVFQRLMKKESISAELATHLKMPIGRKKAHVNLRFIMVKNEEEEVQFVVVLVDKL